MVGTPFEEATGERLTSRISAMPDDGMDRMAETTVGV